MSGTLYDPYSSLTTNLFNELSTGMGEVELKGPYVALTPSPIIAVLENRKRIAKRVSDGGGCKMSSTTKFLFLVPLGG